MTRTEGEILSDLYDYFLDDRKLIISIINLNTNVYYNLPNFGPTIIDDKIKYVLHIFSTINILNEQNIQFEIKSKKFNDNLPEFLQHA